MTPCDVENQTSDGIQDVWDFELQQNYISVMFLMPFLMNFDFLFPLGYYCILS